MSDTRAPDPLTDKVIPDPAELDEVRELWVSENFAADRVFPRVLDNALRLAVLVVLDGNDTLGKARHKLGLVFPRNRTSQLNVRQQAVRCGGCRSAGAPSEKTAGDLPTGENLAWSAPVPLWAKQYMSTTCPGRSLTSNTSSTTGRGGLPRYVRFWSPLGSHSIMPE